MTTPRRDFVFVAMRVGLGRLRGNRRESGFFAGREIGGSPEIVCGSQQQRSRFVPRRNRSQTFARFHFMQPGSRAIGGRHGVQARPHVFRRPFGEVKIISRGSGPPQQCGVQLLEFRDRSLGKIADSPRLTFASRVSESYSTGFSGVMS